MSARYSANAYSAAYLALLPQGLIWPRDPDSAQRDFAVAVAKSFARSDANASDLLATAFPGRALDLLPEWEATVGLPDECGSASGTLADRRAQVVSRLQAGGGQSRADYINLAATLGFEVEVRAYAPFRVGENCAGQPLYGEAWAFAMGIVVLSSSGDTSLATLKCQLGRAKPAEIVITYPDA